MSQEQNNISVDAALNNQQIVEQPKNEENQTLREHYLQLVRQMCPNMSEDKTDDKKLLALQNRSLRLIEMLNLFGHSWAEETPILQKACLSYLATESLSRKERQRIIDAWTGWSDFQFRLARYRGLLSQFLQYHHRIGHELESLLSQADAETAPESPETNQEGGI